MRTEGMVLFRQFIVASAVVEVFLFEASRTQQVDHE